MARTARKEKEVDHARIEILRAAARAANRAGFDALTIRDIAKEADYTVGTLYNYFKGKDAILTGLLDHLSGLLLLTLQAEIPAGLTFRQKVELLVQRQLAFAEEWRDGVMTILLVLWGSPTAPMDVANASRMRDGFAKWLRANASSADLGGKDRLEVAMFYLGVLQAVLAAAVQKGTTAPLTSLLPRIMDLLFHGLAGKK